MNTTNVEKNHTAKRLKAIFTGSVGNLVEWYDWYAYAAFALYFAPVFFPKGNPTAQLLDTAAIFAVGFLMRPVGGWLFGSIADRAGRKTSMTLSVLLMSAGSLMIALAPSFATAGVLSPIILLTARLIQGLSVGGEYGTSATYLSEISTAGKRGFSYVKSWILTGGIYIYSKYLRSLHGRRFFFDPRLEECHLHHVRRLDRCIC